MKITEITTYSVHTTQFRNFNFVRIDTDEGIHGIGELFCIGADKAVAEMVKYVSEWVVGMDPLDRERIQKRIINYSRFPGGSVLYTAASALIWHCGTLPERLPTFRSTNWSVQCETVSPCTATPLAATAKKPWRC